MVIPAVRISPLSIDLSLLQRRSVTSLYSNLVTRPTGQAIRMGVENQIAELDGGRSVCLSILDFSQVRVLDYSCADEIVAKLLLRYQGEDRPAEAFFIGRGIQEHHREPIEEVLERHALLLVVEGRTGEFELLGRADISRQRCWNALLSRGRASVEEIAASSGLSETTVTTAMLSLVARRVVIDLAGGILLPTPSLLGG